MSEVSAELLRRAYNGVRIKDDPANPACFAVVCVRHKTVGRKLNLLEARTLLAEHLKHPHD